MVLLANKAYYIMINSSVENIIIEQTNKAEELLTKQEVTLGADQIYVLSLSNLNTSNKIRHLDNLGWTRSRIAIALNKRYQHVRNVLITPVKSTANK